MDAHGKNNSIDCVFGQQKKTNFVFFSEKFSPGDRK